MKYIEPIIYFDISDMRTDRDRINNRSWPLGPISQFMVWTEKIEMLK